MLLKSMGIVLIIDGSGSIAWYKQEPKIVPTFFRLLRTAIGICLVLVG